MTTPDTKHKTISVVIRDLGAAERDYLTGVFRFVNTQANWSIKLYSDRAGLEGVLSDRAASDGILAVLPHRSDAKAALWFGDVPTVLVDIPPDRASLGNVLSFVRLDDRQIGRAAAEHFLARGSFNAYLCVVDQPEFEYPSHREAGFRSLLADTGKPVETLRISESVLDARETEAIRRTLTSLPHPLAVFAVRDRAALKVFDVCRRFRLAIPNEVAVLGVDNDELFCTSLKPPLSSVLPDHELIGFLAARELARLIRHGDGREIVSPKSVKRIVLRESTRIIPPAARILSQAMDFIEANASGALRVSDVAHHVGVSRRLLDLRFRQVHGGTVLEAIVQARIRRMKKKLRTSAAHVDSLATECGFSSPAVFTRFFTRHVGVSPTAWRKATTRPRHR